MPYVEAPDYSTYYSLEDYLFGEVSNKFENKHFLNSFDFFCIIIWKANRAKSTIAKKLITISKTSDLNIVCEQLTRDISNAKNNKDKLRILLTKWKLRLPIASAILTVLYPDVFTIYDVRVCNVIGKYKYLADKKPEVIVEEYFEFVKDVIKEVPEKATLRAKDKYLWGKSFYQDLENDIKNNFSKNS